MKIIHSHGIVGMELFSCEIPEGYEIAGPTVTVIVPPHFWDDHSDRAPSDYNDGRDICVEIKRTKTKVWLECTPEQLANFRGDAEYYSHRWGPSEAEPGLKRSAKATLAAIIKQVGK